MYCWFFPSSFGLLTLVIVSWCWAVSPAAAADWSHLVAPQSSGATGPCSPRSVALVLLAWLLCSSHSSVSEGLSSVSMIFPFFTITLAFWLLGLEFPIMNISRRILLKPSTWQPFTHRLDCSGLLLIRSQSCKLYSRIATNRCGWEIKTILLMGEMQKVSTSSAEKEHKARRGYSEWTRISFSNDLQSAKTIKKETFHQEVKLSCVTVVVQQQLIHLN